MGFNEIDPKKRDGRQGVEPLGETVSVDAAAFLFNQRLFGLKYSIRALFAIAFPILTILAVYNLWEGRLIVAVLVCCMEGLLLWSYFLMRKYSDKSIDPAKQYGSYQNVIRGFLLIFFIFISYSVGWKSELDRVQWSYIFPVAAFVCLGKREGFCWVTFFLASMVLFLFYPRPDAFSPDAFLGFKLRYLISFSIMCAVAFAGKSGIEVTYTRLVDRQGQLAESEKQCREAYDGLQREMKERRQSQQALAESEGLYRMIADNVSDILWTMDLNYRFNYVSPSIMKVRGFTVEEALSQRLEEMLTPESLHAAVQAMAEEAERLKRHPEDMDVKKTIEMEQYRKDGSTIWTENEINYLFDQDRQPIGIIGVTREISKRKRIETALRESEERFRSIAENSKEVIWMMDMNLRFTYINPYIEHNMGYTPEEYLQMPLDKLMTPASLNMCMLLLIEELENERRGDRNPNRSRMIEVDHIHKDGKTVYAEIKMTFIRDASGRASGILGLTRDISENKRLEAERRNMDERLQRAEKMEALGQLAGGVAHDLNNVLGVSTIYSELLREKIPEESPLRNYVDNILSSTQKGAAIIEDLLTLARRGVAVSDLMNLNGIASNYLKGPVFEKMQAYHPRVTFRTERQAELLNIKGSPLHLEKTLMNLVSNAAEAISGKGEVTIRTENRYLDKPIRGYDNVKEGDYAVLTVSDTGRGIPAENREKIFEPFYTKKTMGRSGTGLGLAIVWGTVKDHNGYIDLQTEVGEGTTFTLYFPATREDLVAQQQKVPIERYMGNGESVLVVDDVEEQQEVAARLLTRLGYQIHVVSSGEEAVEYLKENRADILVLDMIMTPGIDGLETYQRVLEINPKQKTILVSGFSETERVKEAQKLGAGAYVKKPYIMEKIGVAVRDELRKGDSNGKNSDHR